MSRSLYSNHKTKNERKYDNASKEVTQKQWLTKIIREVQIISTETSIFNFF
jgi:hypothetical protein